jgi:hypothetical protein
LPTLTAAESALLQLSDIAEKFGAGGAQFVLIALKALQDGRIALIEDVAAESLSIFSTRPVALLADATLLCERQR